MSLTRAIITFPLASLLAGCGAILHGARQEILVQSSPSGAKVTTSPEAGTFATPTTLNLERKNSYVITFTSPGYSSATFNVQNQLGIGTVVADVLLTGLVGVVIDGITGSWYGLTPESATVTLNRAGTGPGPASVEVHLDRAKAGGGIAVTSDSPGVLVQVRKK